MQAITQLTRTVNVFVRFFESINCLFWQLRWLEQNMMGQSNERMAFFGIIILICLYVTFFSDTGPDLGPFLIIGIIFLLAVWLILKRFRGNAGDSGNTSGEGECAPSLPWDTGNGYDRRGGQSRDEYRYEDREALVHPSAPSMAATVQGIPVAQPYEHHATAPYYPASGTSYPSSEQRELMFKNDV